jgi:hypothetical protein
MTFENIEEKEGMKVLLIEMNLIVSLRNILLKEKNEKVKHMMKLTMEERSDDSKLCNSFCFF